MVREQFFTSSCNFLRNTHSFCIHSPLLAIANVLLLRGRLQIHPQQIEISFEELASMLKEYLTTVVTKQAESAGNESKIANLLHSHDEALRLFPKLEQGLGTPSQRSGFRNHVGVANSCMVCRYQHRFLSCDGFRVHDRDRALRSVCDPFTSRLGVRSRG